MISDLPPGSCDCHHHVFDARFPYVAGDRLQPKPAPLAAYRAVQQRLGTTRSVVVQPSSYGTDNRASLAAMSELGDGARGVAVLNPAVSDAELERLHAAGMRGVRFNLSRGGAGPEAIQRIASRIAPFGWHVDIHLAGEDLPSIAPMLRDLPVPIVFDHLGRVPQPEPESHPAFRLIADLLEAGRAWVKLSQFRRDAREPDCADVGRLVRRYAAIAPERLVWGTDWPHVVATHPVDELDDLRLLLQWLPDRAMQGRILATNAAALYGFPPAA